MELAVRKKWGPPQWELVEMSGPHHAKNFMFKGKNHKTNNNTKINNDNNDNNNNKNDDDDDYAQLMYNSYCENVGYASSMALHEIILPI